MSGRRSGILTADVVLYGTLNVLCLLNVDEMDWRRRSRKAHAEAVKIDHRGAIRFSVLLELPKHVLFNADVVGAPALVAGNAENNRRDGYSIRPKSLGQRAVDERLLRRSFDDHVDAAQ
jgi:hypothetical protein